MANIFIQICSVKDRKGIKVLEPEDERFTESFTDDIHKLFEDLEDEFGDCAGHLLDENKNAEGWIFRKMLPERLKDTVVILHEDDVHLINEIDIEE